MSLHFHFIDTDSEYYGQVLDLRNEVLRKPLGMELSTSDVETDHKEIIVIARQSGRVLASVQLRPLDKQTVKLRQMAVASGFRHRGIGTKLLKQAEQKAAESGFKRVVLHARKTALKFYLENHYKIISGEFIEVGIPHFLMKKSLDR